MKYDNPSVTAELYIEFNPISRIRCRIESGNGVFGNFPVLRMKSAVRKITFLKRLRLLSARPIRRDKKDSKRRSSGKGPAQDLRSF